MEVSNGASPIVGCCCGGDDYDGRASRTPTNNGACPIASATKNPSKNPKNPLLPYPKSKKKPHFKKKFKKNFNFFPLIINRLKNIFVKNKKKFAFN
jgi:hypothetical protein